MRANFSINYPDDLDEWQQQFPSISALGQTPGADQLLGQALAGFRGFSAEFIDYFEGPQGIIPRGQFDVDETTPARLGARVRQTLDDYWAPLAEIAQQRKVDHYRRVLDEGTREADRYLARLQDVLGLQLPGVLLYFDKVDIVRRCPYTDIAFIGTPYRPSVEGDWLAVAHELAHHVYWNLGDDLADLAPRQEALKWELAHLLWSAESLRGSIGDESRFEAFVDMLQDWAEEIFADVGGTMIGGPAYVDSLLKLIERSAGNRQDLKENDGNHPPLCVRPYVRELSQKWFSVLGSDPERFPCDRLGEISLPPDSGPSIFETRFEELYGIEALSRIRIESMRIPDSPTETPETLTPFWFTVGQVSAGLKLVVEYFVNYLICQSHQGYWVGKQAPSAPSPFEQLQAAVRAQKPQEKVYESLLSARMLVGGQTHTHHLFGYHGGVRKRHITDHTHRH